MTLRTRGVTRMGTIAAMDANDVIMPPKIKGYAGRAELLSKLGEKEAMWERVARDAQERAEEFARAAREVREGATTVTVGRTTYTLE